MFSWYEETSEGRAYVPTMICTATAPRSCCGIPGASGAGADAADSTTEGRHPRKEVAALSA
ncbi:hypothetical protein DBP15_24075 [Streptomyces sp. CS065A]|nr:hypothetical protein DBP15_24075 [Streptomyces sp. CS065A]